VYMKGGGRIGEKMSNEDKIKIQKGERERE
jgi:hypothetical protein